MAVGASVALTHLEALKAKLKLNLNRVWRAEADGTVSRSVISCARSPVSAAVIGHASANHGDCSD